MCHRGITQMDTSSYVLLLQAYQQHCCFNWRECQPRLVKKLTAAFYVSVLLLTIDRPNPLRDNVFQFQTTCHSLKYHFLV